MEVSGKCTQCGAPLPLEGETGGWVRCENCGMPNLIPVVFSKPVERTAEPEPAPAASPDAKKDGKDDGKGKKGKSALEVIAIVLGVFFVLNMICGTLGFLPAWFFLKFADPSAATLMVVGIALATVFFGIVLVALLRFLVRK